MQHWSPFRRLVHWFLSCGAARLVPFMLCAPVIDAVGNVYVIGGAVMSDTNPAKLLEFDHVGNLLISRSTNVPPSAATAPQYMSQDGHSTNKSFAVRLFYPLGSATRTIQITRSVIVRQTLFFFDWLVRHARVFSAVLLHFDIAYHGENDLDTGHGHAAAERFANRADLLTLKAFQRVISAPQSHRTHARYESLALPLRRKS